MNLLQVENPIIRVGPYIFELGKNIYDTSYIRDIERNIIERQRTSFRTNALSSRNNIAEGDEENSDQSIFYNRDFIYFKDGGILCFMSGKNFIIINDEVLRSENLNSIQKEFLANHFPSITDHFIFKQSVGSSEEMESTFSPRINWKINDLEEDPKTIGFKLLHKNGVKSLLIK